MKRVVKVTLQTLVASERLLNSLPKVRVNSKVIPIYGSIASEIPFVEHEGIFCPICPSNVVADLVLMGQMKTDISHTRAYLFWCTACQTVSYLPVTKRGEFQVTFAKIRRSLAEIHNPILSLITALNFDFSAYLMQTAIVNYQETLDSMYTKKNAHQLILQLKRMNGGGQPVYAPAEVQKSLETRRLAILLKLIEFDGSASIRTIALALKIEQPLIADTMIGMVKEKLLTAIAVGKGKEAFQIYQIADDALKTVKEAVEKAASVDDNEKKKPTS